MANRRSVGSPSNSVAIASFEENGDGTDHQVCATSLKLHAIDAGVIYGILHGRGPRHRLYCGVLSDLFLPSFHANLGLVRPERTEGQPLEVRQEETRNLIVYLPTIAGPYLGVNIHRNGSDRAKT
ncbi:MAG: hypothetical protein ABSC55_12660 [Syntrophorhabdales bacterium]